MVVSDTSVITALLTVGAAELLPRLFGEVVIPWAVRNELLRCHRQLPTWLRVEAVKDAVQVGRYARSVELARVAELSNWKRRYVSRASTT